MAGKRGDRSTEASVRLADVVATRHAALRDNLEAARQGTVHGVHQARVATRRLRETVPIAAVNLSGTRRRRLRRVLRTLTRALGDVRECDVSLAMIDALATTPSGGSRQWQRRWIRDLTRRRRRARTHLLEVSNPADVAWLDERLSGLAELRRTSPDLGWQRRLGELLDTRGRTRRASIDAAGVMWSADPLHEVRIATKRLRYALELTGECGLAAVARPLSTLKKVQDVLGRLHDIDVVLAHVRSPDDDGAPDADADLDETCRTLEHERHRLHATYLRRRAALIAVADLVRDDLGPPLTDVRASASADLAHAD